MRKMGIKLIDSGLCAPILSCLHIEDTQLFPRHGLGTPEVLLSGSLQ